MPNALPRLTSWVLTGAFLFFASGCTGKDGDTGSGPDTHSDTEDTDTDTDTGTAPETGRRTELLECVVEPDGCDVILAPDDSNMILLQGPGYTGDDGLDHAGQTVCIPSGTYLTMSFNGLRGSADNPILITNCGEGQVIVDTQGQSSGMAAHGTRYLHFSGTGDPDQEYGIVLKNMATGRMGIDMSDGVSDIEIDYFEIAGPAYAGIAIRNYPYCDETLGRDVFTQYNTLVHHNYIHDVSGEGIYLGCSHYHAAYSPTSGEACAPGIAEPAMRGVEVHHNLVEEVGRDGIQVGTAIEGMLIHNNVIRNYALLESWGHVGGIQVNPGSVGRVYSNLIVSKKGNMADNGIQFAGGEDGPTYLYNNVIVGSRVPFLALTRMGNLDSPVHLLNNTMIGRSDGGRSVYLFCDPTRVQDFFVTNNIFAGAELAGLYLYTNREGQVLSKIVDGYAENCPINGQVYDNDLDENQKIPGNFYDSDAAIAGFVDLEGGDYHLDAGSPAVGAGVNLSDIFSDDFEGNDRGAGPFELGAYRY
jgi:hypothetical protein